MQRTQPEEEAISVEKKFEEAIELLDKFKRTAYVPFIENKEPTFSRKSKIGGAPFLRNENDWPVCPNCTKKMQFFMQLNLETLPENVEEGILQLFYCTSEEPLCEDDLEAFFPFSKAVECRLIQGNEDSAKIELKSDEVFDEKQITGWMAKDDYPHPEEYDNLGIDLEFEDEIREMMEERNIGQPLQGDKLFGWPYWIQSVEYPFDRKTERQMKLLFQLDSEVNLPYMFGDSGVGHITQSPDNKEELAFGWACC